MTTIFSKTSNHPKFCYQSVYCCLIQHFLVRIHIAKSFTNNKKLFWCKLCLRMNIRCAYEYILFEPALTWVSWASLLHEADLLRISFLYHSMWLLQGFALNVTLCVFVCINQHFFLLKERYTYSDCKSGSGQDFYRFTEKKNSPLKYIRGRNEFTHVSHQHNWNLTLPFSVKNLIQVQCTIHYYQTKVPHKTINKWTTVLLNSRNLMFLLNRTNQILHKYYM
jgi:hypothetical protein